MLAVVAALAAFALVPGRGDGQVRIPRPPADTARRVPPPGADTLRPRADSVRAAADTVRADSARRPAGPRRARAAVARPELRPPLSPRRAFLYSLALPGLGQSKLDRPAAGALFVTVEAMALVMARKSLGDLREAKRLRGDSLVPALYPVDSTAAAQRPTATRVPNVFNNALVRSRRLHFEDWVAVMAFNHLFAGAEAFVAANLWDVPARVSASRSDVGPVLRISLPW